MRDALDDWERALEARLAQVDPHARAQRSPAEIIHSWRHAAHLGVDRIGRWLDAGVVLGHRAELLAALGVQPEHLHGVVDPALGPLGAAFSRSECDVHHVRAALRAAGRAVPTPPSTMPATPSPLDEWVLRRIGAKGEE